MLDRLVEAGNTVLVVEHHLDVIKTADWVIDLGPEGGEAGGGIVAEGTPEQVAQVDGSYTGKFLREVLPRAGATRPDGMNYHHLLEAIGILVSGLLFYSYTYSWFPLARADLAPWRAVRTAPCSARSPSC